MSRSTWIERLYRLLGSGPGPPEDWVGRMILHATGELTPTREYVFRHGVWTRRREGGSVPDEFARGEWDAGRHEEFRSDWSRAAVEAALADLEERGLIRRVEPAPDGERDEEHWRLTEEGRAERARLLDRFREEIDELQRRHGVVVAEVVD